MRLVPTDDNIGTSMNDGTDSQNIRADTDLASLRRDSGASGPTDRARLADFRVYTRDADKWMKSTMELNQTTHRAVFYRRRLGLPSPSGATDASSLLRICNAIHVPSISPAARDYQPQDPAPARSNPDRRSARLVARCQRILPILPTVIRS